MGGIIDSDNVDIGDFFEKVGLVRLAKQRQCTSSKVLSRIQLRFAFASKESAGKKNLTFMQFFFVCYGIII